MTTDDLLSKIDINVQPFALCELNANTPLNLDHVSSGIFHYVLSGSGEITMATGKRVYLTEGNLILIPSYVPHILHGSKQHCSELPICRPLELKLENIPKNRSGHQPTSLVVLCAYADLTYGEVQNVLRLLNEPLIGNIDDNPITQSLVFHLTNELTHPRIGSNATVRGIVWIILLQLLRDKAMEDKDGMKWLTPIEDPRLLPAIEALLNDPDQDHTIESLASIAAMSRSSFAARFSATYGSSAIKFLRAVRLHRAARMLGNPVQPIERIARTAGYKSRNSFSRAFKDAYGASPKEYRQKLKLPQVSE